MHCRKQPCAQCPWRKDIETGQFPADRYEELAATSGEKGAEAPYGAPIFACHKGTEENPMPCAGWLAAIGYHNLTIRLAVLNGDLPQDALSPGEDWPPLYESYAEMMEAQGGERGASSYCDNEKCRYFAQVQSVVPGRACPGCRGEMIDASMALERRR